VTTNRTVEVAALFVAQELVISWELFGGENRARELIADGLVILAGLPKGISYWDHEALAASGKEAAELALLRAASGIV
jgi:hypothetical protein